MPTREDAEKQLAAKAAKDPKFKESLLRDPRAAISREFGLDVPTDISIKVLQETAESIYIVLPASSPRVEGGELTDSELETVAAGKAKTPPTPAPVCTDTIVTSTCRVKDSQIDTFCVGQPNC